MKKFILICAALLFSYLFHSQTMGINALLFIGILLYHSNLITKVAKSYAVATVITAISVAINPSASSLVVLFLTTLTFIGIQHSTKLSVYLAIFQGFLTSIFGAFQQWSQPKEKGETQESNAKFWFISAIIIIPVVLIFLMLYKSSNPIFSDWIDQIDLSFISFGFLFMALLGFIFFKAIQHPFLKDEIEKLELQTQLPLLASETIEEETHQKKLKNEQLQASILIGILNVMLFLFLISDVLLYQNSEALQSFSQNVHSGINTLITSIILAVIIISIYFRGDLNFYQENSTLKKITYGWIFLNILLVVSTLYKDWLYVSVHGLTYKRIGVFVYLTLVIAGLYNTFRKVKTQQPIWFVVRKTFSFGFVFFVVLSLVPYGKLVTVYNIKHAPNLNIEYLLTLPEDNSVILWENKEYVKQRTGNDYSKKLHKRYYNYQTNLETRDWQSYSLDNFIYSK
ncbi:protein of unknown function [Pustulibacterium marinum]|uniref:Uncharacterized protein n=1 Tax=Pustulibacterium marinum TaxID=1224947 RepID=A0A1I7HUV4_9FLAO|nr:DUF4153 domain-containing protein [Pustulibacterium marinum]SFU64359.1 protein of unknown function [Pustulibacterium marinum]